MRGRDPTVFVVASNLYTLSEFFLSLLLAIYYSQSTGKSLELLARLNDWVAEMINQDGPCSQKSCGVSQTVWLKLCNWLRQSSPPNSVVHWSDHHRLNPAECSWFIRCLTQLCVTTRPKFACSRAVVTTVRWYIGAKSGWIVRLLVSSVWLWSHFTEVTSVKCQKKLKFLNFLEQLFGTPPSWQQFVWTPNFGVLNFGFQIILVTPGKSLVAKVEK